MQVSEAVVFILISFLNLIAVLVMALVIKSYGQQIDYLYHDRIQEKGREARKRLEEIYEAEGI